MTTWTPIAKPAFPTSSVAGVPIGLLIALTKIQSTTVNPWTDIPKASGTSWTNFTKPSGTSWTNIPKAS